MDNLCEGFPKTETQKVIQWGNLVVGVLYSSTSLLTCFCLYRKPGTCKSVPWFVTLQMAALVVMVPFSLTFFSLLQRDINTATEITK